MTEDKLKLFSDDSERAVLSILLQYPDMLYEVVDLKPTMFSSVPNSILFRTILELDRKNLIPEPIVIIEHLKANGELDSAGGVDYIEYLSRGTYVKENIKKFYRIVVDSYRGRVLLALINKAPAQLQSTGDVDAVLQYLRTGMEDLNTAAEGNFTISMEKASAQHLQEIIKRMENPGVAGWSTGFTDLDYAISGANPGDFILVAGRPGMGKSTWMCNSVLNAGLPALIFSKEMNTKSLMDRFIAIDSGVPLMDIRQGTVSAENLEKIKRATEKLTEYEIYIDENFMANIDYISSTIRKYHFKHKIRAVYIDYVQLVAERDESAVHELGKITRNLKLLAESLGIVVYLFSQLNRMVETRDDKRPVLSDLRQSGNLEEDPDIVIFLYRDEYYNRDSKARGLVENILRKNRNGPIGTFNLEFKPETLQLKGI